jgi:hypothetical protein
VSLFKYSPSLSDAPELVKTSILLGFAGRVRSGAYGRGAQIKVSSVADALSAISQTLGMANEPSPVYKNGSDQTYILPIERMMEGFRREDPPAIPQLAVPITVVNRCFETAVQSDEPRVQAIGQLALIAFYFLLRVGEYTKPKFFVQNGIKRRATRTKQFTYANVGFFKDNAIVPRSSSLETLLTCDSATLKISNQKNGRMGCTIHQKATGTDCCPIKALAYRINHINVFGGASQERLLCDYCENDEWHSATSKDIITIVRLSAKSLNLQNNGIDPDLIGAHSLRAGGAMALKLHGFDNITIMKMGRWTSLTFSQYIHNQIACLSEDISRKMSMPLPFVNIASIENNNHTETT